MKSEHNLPSPPTEEHAKSSSSSSSTKRVHSKSSKSTKPPSHHRASKRTSTSTSGTAAHAHHVHLHSPLSPDSSSVADSRHKRVWKACERCRMKKTKCDGEFPCKRCKDDGLVCTAGVRKKTEFKQLPRGYAEVLENTQFALISTVHKLYAMVRNGTPWELGEPDLNDRGLPVIHNIAQKLGCLRPHSDIDLPVNAVFPEDEQGLADLAAQLEATQQQQPSQQARDDFSEEEGGPSSGGLRIWDEDYRREAFGGGGGGGRSALTASPVSLAYESFNDSHSALSSEGMHSPVLNTAFVGGTTPPPSWMTSPTTTTAAIITTTNAANTTNGKLQQRQEQRQPQRQISPTTTTTQQPQLPMGFNNGAAAVQYIPGPFGQMDMLSQGLFESDLGTIKPHLVDCPNPEVMMGMGDPMMSMAYGYDPEMM